MTSPAFSRQRGPNRREVLEELALSEARYGKRLKAALSSYMTPLLSSRLLSPAESSALWRGIADMKEVSSKLGSLLAAAAEEEDVSVGLHLAASEFKTAKAALMELYLPFVRGHEGAMHALRSVMSRGDVARAVDSIASSDERVRGASLGELLSLPLDRVQEYKDLLSLLVSATSPSERCYPALLEAGDLFSAICREVYAVGYTPKASGSTHMSPLAHSIGGSYAPSSGATNSYNGVHTYPTPDSHTSVPQLSAAPLPATSATHQPAVSLAAALSPLHTTHVGSSNVTADAVIAAQAEADEAARRLHALEREVELKDSELSVAAKDVARAEAERSGARLPDTLPLDDAVRKLADEEKDLLSRISNSEQRALFESFLARKRELEDEEARLSESLEEHEDMLSKVRARLANPPPSLLPTDPAKASLYLAWKRALAEREELLRQARKRKHELIRDLKTRHETQVVLLEMERRAAVDNLNKSVEAEREKVEAYKKELVSLDESIESARNAMSRFRQEFEQLRVALLIDKMAKSSQVANLADRRRRLARESEQFQEAVEAAKQRIASEEAAKWEARLAVEREAGEQRVAEERQSIESKIDKVRSALAERYEAGFKPLLMEAEARHVEELNKLVALQKELESKEAELRAAHEGARAVSSAVASLSDDGRGSGDVSDSGGDTPEWKIQEFNELRSAVTSMWEQLDIPAEDVTAFLSECDLLAPYHSKVLEMYQDMYKRMIDASSVAAAMAVTAASAHSSPEKGGAASGTHTHTADGAHTTPSKSVSGDTAAAARLEGYNEAATVASSRAQALLSSPALLSPGYMQPIAPYATTRSKATAALAATPQSRGDAMHRHVGLEGYRSAGLTPRSAASTGKADMAAARAHARSALSPSMGGPGARSTASAKGSAKRSVSPGPGRR